MKFLVKRQTTQEVEIDVSFPYFCKNESTFYKVTSIDSVVKITNSGMLPELTLLTIGEHTIGREDLKQCTEEDFNQVYESFMNKTREFMEMQ